MVERRVLSGPAILRISILLLVAGVLAALAQFLMPVEPPAPASEPTAAGLTVAPEPAPQTPPSPAKPPSTAPPPAAPSSAAPSSAASSSAPSSPVPPAPTVPAPTPAPAEPAPAPAAPAPPPERRAETPAVPAQPPADTLTFPPAAPPVPAPPQAPPPRGEAEVARAEETAGPRALAIVDLNTASAAELNRLRGGGAIGRAIVAKRPYASVDQLLSKRVLSRAVYDRIKDQVTVR